MLYTTSLHFIAMAKYIAGVAVYIFVIVCDPTIVNFAAGDFRAFLHHLHERERLSKFFQTLLIFGFLSYCKFQYFR